MNARIINSADQLRARIAKRWMPNQYLTNMSLAYFQNQDDFVAGQLFPIIPVPHSTASYYIFSKADLARDNVDRKPQFGKVAPMLISSITGTYRCEVDQIILGIDTIQQTDYQRAGTPGASDPRRAKVRVTTEQISNHLDIIFARHFFRPGVWANEMQGVDSAPTDGQFLKFTDTSFNPITFFDQLCTECKRKGRRRPNRLGLGPEAWNGLKSNPFILDRVTGTGSTNNPAMVTRNTVAQVLELDAVTVMESTYNAAPIGKEDMQYICDPKGALLCYATPTPAIDEPSAGYIFAWDMLGDGQTMAFDQFDGESGTHAEFIEGLMAYDMRQTAPDLAVYLKDCV